MNPTYQFESEQFGIDSNAIYLLRNRYNYQTIHANEIESIEIKTGKDLKKWLVALIIGLGLLLFVVFDIFRIYHLLTSPFVYHIELNELLIPVFPLALGIYSVIISFRTTRVMIVRTKRKHYYFSLRKLVKEESIHDFEKFMDEKYAGITNKR